MHLDDLEELKRNNLPAVITFINFKNVFDSIHWGKMITILRVYAIPPNLRRAIENTHTGTMVRAVTPTWDY